MEFREKIQQANYGKEIFENIFKNKKLYSEDTFLLVLTNNEECVQFGIKYLQDFIKMHKKKNVYIFMSNDNYKEEFSIAGGIVIICKDNELKKLAIYFSIFFEYENSNSRIIFLTERDEYGLVIEDFLDRKEFTLEEYVAISLYQLKQLKGEK